MVAPGSELEIAISFQLFKVSDVLWTADSSLIRDQKCFAQKGDREFAQLRRDFSREGFFSGHAANAGKKINPIRSASELNDLFGLPEVGGLNS